MFKYKHQKNSLRIFRCAEQNENHEHQNEERVSNLHTQKFANYRGGKYQLYEYFRRDETAFF